MNLKHLPNLISILRMILVIPVVLLMLERQFEWALGLFIVAGLSDAVDGYLAKRFNWISRLGEILDPLADKLLMVSCYIVLWWLNYLPEWLVSIVIGRDILIVLGAIVYRTIIKLNKITATQISKVNTTAQILLICIVLFSIVAIDLPETMLTTIFVIVFLTTMASGIDYVVIWYKQLFNKQYHL